MRYGAEHAVHAGKIAADQNFAIRLKDQSQNGRVGSRPVVKVRIEMTIWIQPDKVSHLFAVEPGKSARHQNLPVRLDRNCPNNRWRATANIEGIIAFAASVQPYQPVLFPARNPG